MEIVHRYFPELTDHQLSQLRKLVRLVLLWNERINLISRKNTDQIELHHVLHSLVIAKFINFRDDTFILDLGTGGGFPGLPLAIAFPACRFTLIDARRKKIRAVQDIFRQLEMQNVTAVHGRVEELSDEFEFIVSRAVAPLDQLMKWTAGMYSSIQRNAIPNGLITLKGGNLRKELSAVGNASVIEVEDVTTYIEDPFFADKKIVYVQAPPR